jgi:hypothetical protein
MRCLEMQASLFDFAEVRNQLGERSSLRAKYMSEAFEELRVRQVPQLPKII